MVQKSIEVEGLKELIAEFENADSRLNPVFRSWLKSMSDFGVKRAQINILNVGAVDTNELIQGMHYELSSGGLESTIKPSEKADKYAAAVEYGSKPHFPPIAALQGWADRHNIPVWLVANKIAREGTEPRHFWQQTFEDLEAHVDGELDNLGDNILRAL